jgi:hypothetical protein
MISDPHLDRLERKLARLRWTMVVSEIIYLIALGLIVRHFLK